MGRIKSLIERIKGINVKWKQVLYKGAAFALVVFIGVTIGMTITRNSSVEGLEVENQQDSTETLSESPEELDEDFDEMSNQGVEEQEEMVQTLPVTGDIRVLLKSEDYTELTHETVKVSGTQGVKVYYQSENIETIEIFEEAVEIGLDDERFADGTIRITPVEEGGKITLHSLTRAYGEPAYYGEFELFLDHAGIMIVNELPLELYLRSVIPSEMPSSYEMEALKAQAVCARSYAYNNMLQYHYPEQQAHVDDSVSFQVYNNFDEAESTNAAIQETEGEKLGYDGKVITTYFFSTSCGTTTDLGAWGVEDWEQKDYLKSVDVGQDGTDYEAELPWYQWSLTVSENDIEEIIEENLEVELGEIESVEVTERGSGEVATELTVIGTDGEATVETENSIRAALASSNHIITRNDGSTVEGGTLLPSGFFEITVSEEEYQIQGGGYGHGIGMSQNGANQMALLGMNYEEILTTFYSGAALIR